MNSLLQKIDAARLACGFLTVEAMMEVLDGNHVLDPFSTLVSAGVAFGKGNILYPGVTLKTSGSANLTFADNNTLHAGCLFEASLGDILVGSGNCFGEGGFTAKANRAGARIRIGNSGRYLNNPGVFGETTLGDGCQLLGGITVDSCTLEGGGSYEEPDPDLRGGLLKGRGLARNLTVPKGKVIAGEGGFVQADLLPQSHFHPKT
ncbi:AraC family transcriptional regulator [Roseibium sp. Sym1]|uniref:AraC family transcriptional regulator n=1 Tax=Roseibium sp. Sym1 TaxID=3016006 RepID=UPI0022B4CB7A|nr:AraC family transcriptional regulator [Roseibium sp. Sym1]